MGQQLERRCEFASALKYYYTGKVYYSKLDQFGSLDLLPSGSDEEQSHGKLRKQFQQLFERLLPHSNKEVSCGCYLFVHKCS
jgi:hypothetical protein